MVLVVLQIILTLDLLALILQQGLHQMETAELYYSGSQKFAPLPLVFQ